MTLVRPDVPASLAARPWDERRNLPIPVVSMFEGKPNFAAINGPVTLDLVNRSRCSLCGKPLPYRLAPLGARRRPPLAPPATCRSMWTARSRRSPCG